MSKTEQEKGGRVGAIDPANYAQEVIELVYQPWTIEVKPYPEGGYFARVVELPGCMTEADSAGEALDALEEARAEWLSAALEMKQTIPKPLSYAEYSGKIFVRASPSLHRAVAELAAKQGVSMSQWASETLAAAVGLHKTVGEATIGLLSGEPLDQLFDRFLSRLEERIGPFTERAIDVAAMTPEEAEAKDLMRLEVEATDESAERRSGDGEEQATFEVYRDSEGGFRWRLVSPNGRILAESRSHSSKESCLEAIDEFRGFRPALIALKDIA